MHLNGTSVHVTAHVTDETTIKPHTDHDDGSWSLEIRGEHSNLWITPSLYLLGAPDDLRRFGERLIAVVDDLLQPVMVDSTNP